MNERTCNICNATGADIVAEEAEIRSNVRAFAGDRFAVWRCKRCDSLHARDEVDLPFYYARYPFHDIADNWANRVLSYNLLGRLKRAGLRPEHRILDYGCGGGNFVKFLRARGYDHVAGFDEYSKEFGDRSVLALTYDCVLSQDVIEHVDSPHVLLDEFQRLAAPGGIIAVGTPNASAISLTDPERTVHALHLPYHRHILSKQALVGAAEPHGWELVHYYSTQYANTPVPFLNSMFYLYYMRLMDNSLDSIVEASKVPKVAPLLLRLPLTLFWGFFGNFFAPETDVMAIFRRPAQAPALASGTPR
ncbi:MAG TPA: class I SAM-dependent methyltransferase [Polyangiaceae bacterium]|nr:class I SAM-dependent methyltransferase [Polyangiaceae bacterium]